MQTNKPVPTIDNRFTNREIVRSYSEYRNLVDPNNVLDRFGETIKTRSEENVFLRNP